MSISQGQPGGQANRGKPFPFAPLKIPNSVKLATQGQTSTGLTQNVQLYGIPIFAQQSGGRQVFIRQSVPR